MNNYETVYKTNAATSFVDYNVKVEHITSRQALELTI